jgi:hypothetical protein
MNFIIHQKEEVNSRNKKQGNNMINAKHKKDEEQ